MFRIPVTIDTSSARGFYFGCFIHNFVMYFTCREHAIKNVVNLAANGLLLKVNARNAEAKITCLRQMTRNLQKSMKLPVGDRVKFQKTDQPNVVYVALPKFWRTHLTLGFLTIFFRAAANLSYKSLRSVLQKGEYFRDTQAAVNFFVGGRRELSPVWLCKFYRSSEPKAPTS